MRFMLHIIFTNLWSDDYTFVKSNSFRHPQKVLNVIPGDFTQDGRLDILVMGQARSSQVSLQMYAGLPQGGFGQSPSTRWSGLCFLH